MLFGKRIKDLREMQGLVQCQLAAVLEVDTPMYSIIESGERIVEIRDKIVKPTFDIISD
ncbi:MAG: helix-turn-helix domain-containing protein [Bacteroidales bacterium]|nr:helix-turn-helix domain-containing protein [Bacteroidales bacterium]